MDIGPRELIVLAVVVLVLFGVKRVPGLAKGIAESVRNIRGAFKDDASPAIAKR